MQRGAISFAFRVIPREVPSFDTLKLPNGVRRLAEEHRGLVLVTGATGSGKTTTLASMLNHINRTRRQHIVTIEDPIEFLHEDLACIVNQREVGLDTQSFGQALRRALRQDPDVILIGELRDAETAETALQAAESGHLVFSTMHTIDAAETLGRLTEFFPAVKQQMIRSILAGVLRGVISQRLIPKVGGGRVAAVEVMVNNARIADLIRDARPDEIHDAIDEGEFFEMQTFSKALIDLVVAGQVDQEIAANASTNRHDFLVALERALKQQAADERAAAEPPHIRSAGHCAAPRFRSARRSRAPRRPFRADVDEARCGRYDSRARSDRSSKRIRGLAARLHDRGADTGAAGPAECRDTERRGLPAPSTRLDRLDAHASHALLRGAEHALAPGRSGLRDSVAGAGRDQQDRVELRPQHGPELRRRRRLDAVHALDLAPLGNGRERRRSRGSLGARGRDLLGGPVPGGRRRAHRCLPRRLRVQPRRLVRA